MPWEGTVIQRAISFVTSATTFTLFFFFSFLAKRIYHLKYLPFLFDKNVLKSSLWAIEKLNSLLSSFSPSSGRLGCLLPHKDTGSHLSSLRLRGTPQGQAPPSMFSKKCSDPQAFRVCHPQVHHWFDLHSVLSLKPPHQFKLCFPHLP